MNRIVLFYFHRHPLVCRNHLTLLRLFNPRLDMYGLYGGHDESFAFMRPFLGMLLGRHIKHIYRIKGKPGLWKWRNTDLAVRLWYQEIGRKLDFDMLHLVQWDLLLLAPIPSLYAQIPKGAIGLSGLVELEKIRDRWYWTTDERANRSTEELFEHARRAFGYRGQPYACLGPGACLSRDFLERYAATPILELGHDELRIPLFAQIFGIEVCDTGFYRSWSDPRENEYFNADSREIDTAVILREIAKVNGRRSFHPFRRILDISDLEESWGFGGAERT
jgi:hypothetical protein